MNASQLNTRAQREYFHASIIASAWQLVLDNENKVLEFDDDPTVLTEMRSVKHNSIGRALRVDVALDIYDGEEIIGEHTFYFSQEW